ncbi:hypothetical protein HY837_03895 [archaeon]|nr:hypothetical protein [archaeon]
MTKNNDIITEWDLSVVYSRFEAWVSEEYGRAAFLDEDMIAFLRAHGSKISNKLIGPNTSPDFKLAWFIKNAQRYDQFVYFDQKYNLGLLFYPASGFDTVPKCALGIDRVVHLSLEGRKGLNSKDKNRYFSKLGEGKKVVGDVKNLPFASDSFNSVFCNVTNLMLPNLKSYSRITKPEGIIIFDSTDFDHYKDSTKESLASHARSQGLIFLEDYQDQLVFKNKK